MPNHLRSRNSDMHKGRASKGRFNLTSALIIVAVAGVLAAILLLS